MSVDTHTVGEPLDEPAPLLPDPPQDFPPLPLAAEETDGFRAPVVRGLAWQLGARGTMQASQLVVAALLAHLLSPRDYGIAAMVLVIITFEPALAGVGLASALVQRPHITEMDKSTVFWTNTAVGTIVCLIGVAVSGPVASFYGDPAVQPLFAAVSGVFLLSALSSVQVHLLVREMDFRALELRSLAGVVIGAIAAIIVAFDGGGAWALIVQQLVFFSVSLVLLWMFSRWRPRLMYSRESLRELRRFGGHMSGTLFMFQMTQNSDNVLIGRFLGASALGLYGLGYNVIMLPFSRITAPLFQVLYPVFSRVQDDLARLGSQWLRVLRLMSALTMPAMLGLIVAAPDLVDVVFGHKWHKATPVIQILSSVGLVLGLQGLNAVVLSALDRTKLLFRYSVVSFIGAMASFVVGLHWGIYGVAGCFAGVSVFIQPFYLRITARAVGLTLGACLRALSGVLQATAVMTVVAYLVRHLLIVHGFAPPVRLAATVLAGAAVYLPMLLWRAPEVIVEVRGLRTRRQAPAPAGATA